METPSQFNFHGDQLEVVNHNNTHHVAVRPICDGIGISFSAQRSTIAGDPILSCANIGTTGADGKRYMMFCIPLDKVNLWLSGIRPDKRRRPEVQARLNLYRQECADVLYRHYMPNGIDDVKSFFNKAFDAGFAKLQQHTAVSFERVETKFVDVQEDVRDLKDRMNLLEDRAKRQDEETADNPFKRKVGDKVH